MLFDCEQPQEATQNPNALVLRVIAWLIFGIFSCGGTYLYFDGRDTFPGIYSPEQKALYQQGVEANREIIAINQRLGR